MLTLLFWPLAGGSKKHTDATLGRLWYKSLLWGLEPQTAPLYQGEAWVQKHLTSTGSQCCYQTQSGGRGLLPPSARLQGFPTTREESHTLCFQIDQPTLGMPSREYYFNEGNSHKVSKEPRGPCQMQFPAHILSPLPQISALLLVH